MGRERLSAACAADEQQRAKHVVGWRSIFLINVPIGAASIALAVRYLDDDPVETKPPLDVLGPV